MYRNCIFCSADLGANEAIEAFPVGRSIAFDGEKGRLWAVCPRCARWNLAPLEERWEAIEHAERLFRDCRVRVQSENVGLAKLRDGSRLIRVGAALPGELAAWRYGGQLARRRRRSLIYGAALGAGGIALVTAGAAVASLGIGGSSYLYWAYEVALRIRENRRTVYAVRGDGGRAPDLIRREDLDAARLSLPGDGGGIKLLLSYSTGTWGAGWSEGRASVVFRGPEARSILTRGLVYVNGRSASKRTVIDSTALIAEAGSPEAFVTRIAQRGHALATPERYVQGGTPMQVPVALALEMALHDEQERQAMEGELSGLEAAWRQAEEIASIADALPDGLDPPEPPRIILPR